MVVIWTFYASTGSYQSQPTIGGESGSGANINKRGGRKLGFMLGLRLTPPDQQYHRSYSSMSTHLTTSTVGTVVKECLNAVAETLFGGKQKDELCEKKSNSNQKI